MATKSYAAFSATLSVAALESPAPGNFVPAPTVGFSFWSNDSGTEKYVVSAAQTQIASGLSLQYVTPSQTYTLQTVTCCQVPPSSLVVDAWIDAGTGNRIIRIKLNGSEQFT